MSWNEKRLLSLREKAIIAMYIYIYIYIYIYYIYIYIYIYIYTSVCICIHSKNRVKFKTMFTDWAKVQKSLYNRSICLRDQLPKAILLQNEQDLNVFRNGVCGVLISGTIKCNYDRK